MLRHRPGGREKQGVTGLFNGEPAGADVPPIAAPSLEKCPNRSFLEHLWRRQHLAIELGGASWMASTSTRYRNGLVSETMIMGVCRRRFVGGIHLFGDFSGGEFIQYAMTPQQVIRLAPANSEKLSQLPVGQLALAVQLDAHKLPYRRVELSDRGVVEIFGNRNVQRHRLSVRNDQPIH